MYKSIKWRWPWMEDDLKWKMTSNGRWPQNMKSRISQPPLVGSYSNLKLKLMGINQSVQRYQMKMISNGRRPQMEDDLQIWEVKYPLSLIQINLKLKLTGIIQGVQRYQMKMTSNGRRPQMDDDLKIWEVQYLSHNWSDLTHI